MQGACPSLPSATLQVIVNGTGVVNDATGGIQCGSDCSENYTVGSVIVLTPLPDPNAYIINVRWDGCDQDNGFESCLVAINDQTPRTVTASFIVNTPL